jgi:hemerythrin-like domain-containing protein
VITKTLIEQLRGEHAVILKKLEYMEQLAGRGESPDVDEFLRFFDEYVVARHHAAEEQQLLPLLRRHPLLRKIVKRLQEEHELERRLVQRLRQSSKPAEMLRVCLQSLRWHVAKENAIVLNSAEAALS